MQLTYTAEQESFRQEIRTFLRHELPSDIPAKVKVGEHLTKQDHERWHALLAAKGWLAIHWPKQFGGTGWGPIQRHIFEEECAAASAPTILPFGVSMVAPVLIRFGTDEQRATYLPRILDGTDWWCQGYSEPGAGSDLASLRMKAVRDGDHYVVTGQKTWTTLGQHANMIFCLVRTDPSAKPQEGISFLLIDMATPGITVRPIITLDGAHEVNEVFFDAVRVPIANRVGEEGKGWTCAKFLLTYERTGIAGIGLAKQALNHLKQVARRETKNGRPLIEDSLFRHRIAEIEIELMACEVTNLRVIAAAQGGGVPGAESSILKIKGTEIRQAITDLMRRAMGPYALPFAAEDEASGLGIADDTLSAAGLYFNRRKLSIYGGSNEIQRNIVSKMIFWALEIQVKGAAAMDFSLNDEQRMLEETVNRLVRDEYAFESRRKFMAEPDGYSPAVWALLAELGVLAVLFKEENGGLSGGGVELLILQQAFGRGLLLEPFVATVVLCGGLIERLGSESQCAGLLPAVIAGERRYALAYGEPQGGYDHHWVETGAVRQGNGWRLSGRKAVVLSGDSADALLVTARTSGRPGERHGISLFLVDAAAEGVRRQGYRTIDGLRGADVWLDAVDLGADALIGPEDGAADALDAVIGAGCAALCAEAAGAMEVACDHTLEYLKTRQQFGAPIGRFQALQHRMVDMRIALEQARSMAILAADALALPAEERDRRLAAAKVLIGNAGRQIAEQAIQLHGGMGMTEETAVSHYAKRLVMIDHYFGDVDYHLARFAATLDQEED